MTSLNRCWRHSGGAAFFLPLLALAVTSGAAPAQRAEDFPERFADFEVLARGRVLEVDENGMTVRLVPGEPGEVGIDDDALFEPNLSPGLIVDIAMAQGHVRFEDTEEVLRLIDVRQRLREADFIEISRIRGMRSQTTNVSGTNSQPRVPTGPRGTPGADRQGRPGALVRQADMLIIRGWVWIRVMRYED